MLTNMSGNLFSAINCDVMATNTEFSNAGGSVLTLIGGKYQFAHCSMVNNMSLAKRETAGETTVDSKCLYLVNNATVNKRGPYPISQAYFDNCIIDGSYSPSEDFQTGGEIEISSGSIFTKTSGIADFNFRFNHCVLKAKETSDSRFTDVIFTAESPQYKKTGGKENKYAYDFRPDSPSTTGVGKADPEITKIHPVDRYGVNRLTSPDGPTIGAYEFVKDPKHDPNK